MHFPLALEYYLIISAMVAENPKIPEQFLAKLRRRGNLTERFSRDKSNFRLRTKDHHNLYGINMTP